MYFARFIMFTGMAGMLIMASGCATTTMSSGVKYQEAICKQSLAKEICVSKVEEGRPDKGASSIGIGFITYIPLVPYAPQRFTPERTLKNALMMDYNFKDDLAQTIIKDLQAAGIVQAVSYDFAGNTKNTELPRIDLTLKEGIWRRNLTTYGCSIAGVWFWVLGAPVSYGYADLAFEAVIRGSDGSNLGRQTFQAKTRLTEFMYSGIKLPKMLCRSYEQISPEFRLFVHDALKKDTVNASVSAPKKN